MLNRKTDHLMHDRKKDDGENRTKEPVGETNKRKKGITNEKSRKTNNEKNFGSIVDFEHLLQYNENGSNGRRRAGRNTNRTGRRRKRIAAGMKAKTNQNREKVKTNHSRVKRNPVRMIVRRMILPDGTALRQNRFMKMRISR